MQALCVPTRGKTEIVRASADTIYNLSTFRICSLSALCGMTGSMNCETRMPIRKIRGQAGFVWMQLTSREHTFFSTPSLQDPVLAIHLRKFRVSCKEMDVMMCRHSAPLNGLSKWLGLGDGLQEQVL